MKKRLIVLLALVLLALVLPISNVISQNEMNDIGIVYIINSDKVDSGFTQTLNEKDTLKFVEGSLDEGIYFFKLNKINNITNTGEFSIIGASRTRTFGLNEEKNIDINSDNLEDFSIIINNIINQSLEIYVKGLGNRPEETLNENSETNLNEETKSSISIYLTYGGIGLGVVILIIIIVLIVVIIIMKINKKKKDKKETKSETSEEKISEPPPISKPQPSEPQPSEPPPISKPQPSEPKPSEPQQSEPKPPEPSPPEPSISEPPPISKPQPSEPQSSEPQPTEPKPPESSPPEPSISEPPPISEPQSSEPQPSEPQISETYLEKAKDLVRKARENKMSDEEIRKLFIDKGWKNQDIEKIITNENNSDNLSDSEIEELVSETEKSNQTPENNSLDEIAKNFIKEAREKGVPDEKIKEIFKKKGWSDSHIERIIK